MSEQKTIVRQPYVHRRGEGNEAQVQTIKGKTGTESNTRHTRKNTTTILKQNEGIEETYNTKLRQNRSRERTQEENLLT